MLIVKHGGENVMVCDYFAFLFEGEKDMNSFAPNASGVC